MLNILEWEKAIKVNGVEYPSAGKALEALSGNTEDITIELNFTSEAPKKQSEAVSQPIAKAPDLYVFKLPAWLAGANDCPMVMQGIITRETSKAFYIEAIGLVESPTICCMCGRELTNDISKRLGIGPICAEKFGGSFGNPEELESKMRETTFKMWIPKSKVELELIKGAVT